MSRLSNAKLKDRIADCQMQWQHTQAPNMEQDRQNLLIDTLLCHQVVCLRFVAAAYILAVLPTVLFHPSGE